MIKSEYRQMRALVLFDLPCVEKEDISSYNKFLKNLKKLGFYMLQYSVYTKFMINESEFERIHKKIIQIIPNKGNIIIIKLTEKQYSDMVYISGEKNRYDSIVGNNNVVMFGGE